MPSITHPTNLSATTENLRAASVAQQQQSRQANQQMADACAADWNELHASVGSFADEHSTL